MMGKGCWRGVLAFSMCALLGGCGWFGGNDAAAPHVKVRPGADRQMAPTGTLPAPPSHRFEQGVTPADEAIPQVGSIVGTKGGQRAQKEAAEKAIAERDAKEREQRDALERGAKGQLPSSNTTPAQAPSADAPAVPEPAPATPKS